MMKDLSMPARRLAFHMGHQPVTGADTPRIGRSTDSIVEKLALGIARALRDFLRSHSFGDENTPYI